MIKEFAVEPKAIVSSYRDFSYVIEKFGVWEGRVISEFPSKWKRLVYAAAQSAHSGGIELKRIEERLRTLPKGILMAMSRPGASGEWLEQALNEHKRQPFDYILSLNEVDMPEVVPIDNFDGNHQCLAHTREQIIKREPAVMANACDFLLKTASHVKLVDPHFDLMHSRFREPFLQFVQRLRAGTLIEIFRDSEVITSALLERANRHLPISLPQGIKVRLIVRPDDDPMHNRFLMTNHGGVRFGVGLDAAGDGAAQEDEVSLMLANVWQARWTQYSNGDVVGEWVGV